MKVRRVRTLQHQRGKVITDKLRIPPDWLPTAKNLKALPRPLQDYIMRLHAFDPQHYVRKVAMLQDHIRMLEADNKRLRKALKWDAQKKEE